MAVSGNPRLNPKKGTLGQPRNKQSCLSVYQALPDVHPEWTQKPDPSVAGGAATQKTLQCDVTCPSLVAEPP